jgi:hypothetical protein
MPDFEKRRDSCYQIGWMQKKMPAIFLGLYTLIKKCYEKNSFIDDRVSPFYTKRLLCYHRDI